MRNKHSFESLPNSSRFEMIDLSQNLLQIHFKTTVAGRTISDAFLWPNDVQDVREIKLFAVNLLADMFGREFGALDPREIECKFNSLRFCC